MVIQPCLSKNFFRYSECYVAHRYCLLPSYLLQVCYLLWRHLGAQLQDFIASHQIELLIVLCQNAKKVTDGMSCYIEYNKEQLI